MVNIFFQDISIVEGVGSAPVVEVISLDQAKAHLYVTGTQDDTYITSLISQCRKAIENLCHISIVPKSITLTCEITNTPVLKFQSIATNYPASAEFEIPEGPITAVTLVQYIDDDTGVTTNLVLNSDYWLKGVLFQTMKVNNSFSNITVVYETGYSAVPYDLQLAILNEIAFRFEQRGEGSNRYASQNVGISEGAQALAAPYKRLVNL